MHLTLPPSSNPTPISYTSNPVIVPSTKLRFCHANYGFVYCTPCSYNELNHTISPSTAPGISFTTGEVMPILTLNTELIAPIIAPESLLLRFPSLTQRTAHKFGKIVQSLTPYHPQLPFQETWNNIMPNINWIDAFKLRRAPFIPPKEKDVCVRIQCNTLPTAARLHSKHIPTVCDYCDEGTTFPNPSHHPPLSLPLSSSPPPPDKLETLQHLLLEYPSSQYIRASLLRTLEFHLNVSISHQAQMIFPPLHNLSRLFPYLLLMTTAMRQLWLSRCSRRFESKHRHPKAILHSTLHLFLIYAQSHLHSLRKSKNKKAHSRLSSYIKAATSTKILILDKNYSISLHPSFKRNWLLLSPFEPP